MSDPGRSDPDSRPISWLVAGALLGVALAAWGILQSDARGPRLPERAVAQVNGALIYSDELERLIAGVEKDTREVATPEVRQRVLDRMIEEELLVQRGLELGLAENDRRVRANLTAAVIRSVVVEAEDRPPEPDELREFFAEESGFFSQPGRLRVRQIFFRVPGPGQAEASKARAAAARERLVTGGGFEAVREELGDEEISLLPDVLLPPTKLREYLGPTALRVALELEVAEWSEPVRSGTGVHLLQVVEREDRRTPAYEEVQSQVRAEFVRRAGDKALRRYLDELRKRADVRVAADFP